MSGFFARCLLIIASALCLSAVLPNLFSIAVKKKDNSPYVAFSAVLEDFILVHHSGANRYVDTEGNVYTLKEYERLMPFVFAGDLVKWGEYPAEIQGEYIPPEKAGTDWDSITVTPQGAHSANLRIQLFPLFESESEFTSISVPPELFRIDKRMEFINVAENKVNEEKSALFTNALNEAGFKFPAKRIAGNPTNNKPYDFGYFVTDSGGEIYRIRQARSKPVIENTGIKTESEIFFTRVRENPNLPYYGLLVTNSGKVYQILKDGYRLAEIWVENYDPLSQRMTYGLDPLNITVKVSDEKGETIYASTRDGIPVKKHSIAHDRQLKYSPLYDTLFPFALSANPGKRGGFFEIRLSADKALAFSFSAALAVLYILFLFIRYRMPPQKSAAEFLLIAALGIYALIAIILEAFGETVFLDRLRKG
jgi:hypothetical protein